MRLCKPCDSDTENKWTRPENTNATNSTNATQCTAASGMGTLAGPQGPALRAARLGLNHRGKPAASVVREIGVIRGKRVASLLGVAISGAPSGKFGRLAARIRANKDRIPVL